MAITASSPDAFFESESWVFDFQVNQPDGSGPMDLTNSRLFARFCDQAETTVGVCDSSASDDSLVITAPLAGQCTFTISVAGRAYKVPRLGQFTFANNYTPQIIGVLQRFASQDAEPVGICEIAFTVKAVPGFTPS